MGFCPPTAIAGETCSWGASCSDIQCGCVYASEDNQKKSTFYESGGVCYHDCLVKCDDALVVGSEEAARMTARGRALALSAPRMGGMRVLAALAIARKSQKA
jgi:hypothetical protein